MAEPVIVVSIVPTGGGIILDITSDADELTLSRAVSGVAGLSAWTQLYSGEKINLWIDVGDELPTALLPTSQYVYKVEDENGSVQTDPLIPACSIELEQDSLTKILMRLLKSGINSLAVPEGFSKAEVLAAMPLTGTPRMPFICTNEDLIQQDEIPIGSNIPKENLDNIWIINDKVTRRYNISILSMNFEERKFYKEAIIGLFKVIANTVLPKIGQDLTHGYQAADTQQTGFEHDPGFYLSEIALNISGIFNLVVRTNLGLTENITFAFRAGQNEETFVEDFQGAITE